MTAEGEWSLVLHSYFEICKVLFFGTLALLTVLVFCALAWYLFWKFFLSKTKIMVQLIEALQSDKKKSAPPGNSSQNTRLSEQRGAFSSGASKPHGK